MPHDAIALLGYGGLALLVLAWVSVSFAAPSPKRVILEWIGACGLYAALVSLFLSLSQRAQESGSTPALVGFGFLVALFGSGLVVSLVQTLLALRSPGKVTSGVTH